MTACQKIEKPASPKVNDLARFALVLVEDEGDCSRKHRELVDWINRGDE